MGGDVNRVDHPRLLPRRTLISSNGQKLSHNKNPPLNNESKRQIRLQRSRQHNELQFKRVSFQNDNQGSVVQGVQNTHPLPANSNEEKNDVESQLTSIPTMITKTRDKIMHINEHLYDSGVILAKNPASYNAESGVTPAGEPVPYVESGVVPKKAEVCTSLNTNNSTTNVIPKNSETVFAKVSEPKNFWGGVKEVTEKPNFFISIKIQSKQVQNEILKNQKTILKKLPDLEEYKVKIAKAHLTLLALNIPTDRLEEAKVIFRNSLQNISCFEILFNGVFGDFDERVTFMQPSSSLDVLKHINKKLLQNFVEKGFICDHRFNPHTSIFQRYDDKLPILKIGSILEKAIHHGGTEFVDKIELCSMTKPKTSDGYFFIESTKQLDMPDLHSDSLMCESESINIIENTTREEDEKSQEPGEQEEGIEIEATQDNLSVIRAIGHLLDLSQRPKDFIWTLKMDLRGTLGKRVREAKQGLLSKHPETKDFLVTSEYVNISFGAGKVLRKPDPEIFRDLIQSVQPTKLSYSDFEVAKAPGTLQYRLKDWATTTDIVDFGDKHNLQFISCIIPIITNINERTCHSLITEDIEKHLIIQGNPSCSLDSGSLFSYEPGSGIERFLKSYGNTDTATGISIGQVGDLLKRAIGDYSTQYGQDDAILTLGNCVYMFQNGSAILYDLGSNLKHVKMNWMR